MNDLLLDNKQLNDFITNGFVRIDNAFSRGVANSVVDILWQQIPFDRKDRSTWSEPVVRLGMFTGKPFLDSVNSPALSRVFDQLVGEGQWESCRSVGTFPVRFPSVNDSNDTGNHVDAGFPGDDTDNYFNWRINIRSKGRALLMLILYSDVSETDAPTVIYKGSHHHVARLLLPHGERGLSFMELGNKVQNLPADHATLATGEAGTIYLCHPFLVHAAQQHRGQEPKFMAQPPLLWKAAFAEGIGESEFRSPVAEAIQTALTT